MEKGSDEHWMQLAIELGAKGKGKVQPNPLVGAVLVKEGQLVGQGYHAAYGHDHAEVAALKDCRRRGNDPSGATIYVTLEPCCHFGKTPPCTEALIEGGVKRVVVAIEDPNPLVGGKGIERLREAGIQVDVGLLKESCQVQNEVFFHNIQQEKPYVIMKSAISLDGKIATKTGESKWITSETSRRHAHQLRGEVQGIMVGIGTVLADDPLLTCRYSEGNRSLTRMVIDRGLEMPLDSKLVTTAKETPLWVVCGQGIRPEKQLELANLGVVLLEQPLDQQGHVDLEKLMSQLWKMKIASVLIEGGGSLNDSAVRAGIVNEVNFYIAPIIIGGAEAKTGVAGLGVSLLSEALQLEKLEVHPLGDDLFIRGKVKRKEDSSVYGNC